MGFGLTSLSGVRRGFMPPQLKTKQTGSFSWSLPYHVALPILNFYKLKRDKIFLQFPSFQKVPRTFTQKFIGSKNSNWIGKQPLIERNLREPPKDWHEKKVGQKMAYLSLTFAISCQHMDMLQVLLHFVRDYAIGPLHVLQFLAVGSWVTWFFSSWERKNYLQSWANSQNDNYFGLKWS